MNDVMICLVGEQPIPNLLPIRYDTPTQVVLAYTESTREVSRRLEKVLHGGTQVYPLKVQPFDILATQRTLEEFADHRGWKPAQLVFNLTGGTKAMAFSAYTLAEKRHCRFLYLESDEVKSHVYRYNFQNDVPLLERDESIPGVITVDDYLKLHLETYRIKDRFDPGKGGKFEETICGALRGAVDEVVPGVLYTRGGFEIDLVVRCANQIGIVETKAVDAMKDAKGIYQLNTAARREFLGTFTKKLLILGTAWERTPHNVQELAQVSDIKVIEFPRYAETGELSDIDRARLVREVRATLGG